MLASNNNRQNSSSIGNTSFVIHGNTDSSNNSQLGNNKSNDVNSIDMTHQDTPVGCSKVSGGFQFLFSSKCREDLARPCETFFDYMLYMLIRFFYPGFICV